jgi:hypothetical protein
MSCFIDDQEAAGPAQEESRDLELHRMKDIVFKGKPKRVFLSRRNLDEVPFPDPKRVHQCLREFNDMSANAVFAQMLE